MLAPICLPEYRVPFPVITKLPRAEPFGSPGAIVTCRVAFDPPIIPCPEYYREIFTDTCFGCSGP